MQNELLFSDDPKVRWQQAQKYSAQKADKLDEEIAQKFKEWPKYWWGVANAWLVFLGPSPGGSKTNNQINWKNDRLPQVGKPHHHFLNTKDGNGFWDRLREWTANSFKLAGVFSHREASFGVTLMANVMATNEGKASNIPDSKLANAMPQVLENLKLVKPRIIVPMDKRIPKHLIKEFKNSGATIKEGPSETLVKTPESQGYPYFKPKYWRLSTKFGPLLIAESPQHPSKANLSIPSEIDQYLAKKIKSCL